MPRTSLLNNLIRTLSVNKQIADGVFDVYNTAHIAILQEYLEGVAPDMTNEISEAIDCILKEAGKFPERQAFNKDGWLVTFPSIDYKRKAISRGTHFDTDPTHGRGGMNLYYKRKGKQHRQTAQQVSSVGGDASTLPASDGTPPGSQQQSAKTSAIPQKVASDNSPETRTTSSEKPQAGHAQQSTKTPAEPPVRATSDAQSTSDTQQAQDANIDAGRPAKRDVATSTAPDNAVTPTQPSNAESNNVPLKTRQFATDKGWTEEKYGNWYNQAGELVAITSTISQEIVPIEINHREEVLAKVRLPN